MELLKSEEMIQALAGCKTWGISEELAQMIAEFTAVIKPIMWEKRLSVALQSEI